MKKTISLIAVIIMMLLSLTACKHEVESISISKTSLNMEPGNNVTLEVTILPDNADDKNVTWTSTDYTVANVVNGTVYAIADGKAQITATTANGKAVTCSVQVETPSAYSQLSEIEKELLGFIENNLDYFKNPTSVSVVKANKISYYDELAFYITLKAQNSFGAEIPSTFIISKDKFFEYDWNFDHNPDIDLAKLNAALKEHITERGW